MAEVYAAYDIDSDREVALKLLPKGQHDDAVIAEIFKRETRALKELKHPNIVELLDSGFDEETNTAYLALEWVKFDLSFVIDRRPFDGWDAFYESTGRPILEALAFSHSRQIAHRDVKLKNVLVDEGQSPKLADFGIAKLRTDIAPGVTLREFVSRPYAPPEPDEGMLVYSRDVYGYGVLALRCLVPRDLKTYEDVYTALDEVDLPPEVYDVLTTVLSRDPSSRPMNAEVLLDRVERIQRPRQSAWEVKARVFLAVTKKACEALRREWPGRADSELEDLVRADLEVFAVEPYKAAQGTSQYLLIGGRCWYHVTVATEEDHFVILNAGFDDELRLEKRRDFAATLRSSFVSVRSKTLRPRRRTFLLSRRPLRPTRVKRRRSRRQRSRMHSSDHGTASFVQKRISNDDARHRFHSMVFSETVTACGFIRLVKWMRRLLVSSVRFASATSFMCRVRSNP